MQRAAVADVLPDGDLPEPCLREFRASGATVLGIAAEAAGLAHARDDGMRAQVGALLMAGEPAGAALGAHRATPPEL